ncbi:splicing factor, proline- and glutamine-rich-like [Drosophila obscura]|uniref:splicing factor, proline- and glutamine-rich-like n=1 Tax=Drosophila obscura TaxID=7282 RepID=UPI001BB20F80|nr:splicing factor, proline- and glutamine-rich-like [Drosophila obscura]
MPPCNGRWRPRGGKPKLTRGDRGGGSESCHKVRTGLFSGPTGHSNPNRVRRAPLWERQHPEPPPQPPSTQQPTPPQSPPPKSPPPNAPTQQSSSRQEEAPKEPPQEEAQRPRWGGPETAVCGPFVSQNVHTAPRSFHGSPAQTPHPPFLSDSSSASTLPRQPFSTALSRLLAPARVATYAPRQRLCSDCGKLPAWCQRIDDRAAAKRS